MTKPTGPTDKPDAIALSEHTRVRLRDSESCEQFGAGAEGTIVHVYDDGATFEIEFAPSGGRPRRVITLDRDAIDPVVPAQASRSAPVAPGF